MLTINAPIFDIDGSEIIDDPDQSGLSQFGRRNSRVATLDGGASVNDFGYSDADRTLDIEWRPASRGQADNVARMVKAYSRLIVSCREGCFLGAPDQFTPGENTVHLRIFVERRLDQ
ncbi:hypothetical protein SAMN04488490_1870 [Marinobacter sp. LV10R510-11A]|uniref:hypothetical protein n=1 Tax=Marinobacter sp. LV10R510-11A TaxID=1415568 RepID=UPI000BB8D918|nr:hypothetical protein [Marinobacter sp. LV10R510-11A]SOB76192.1 hypothetical protein SAMN04488490_1870 [Marinobacter sp. LV10R510-11A]